MNIYADGGLDCVGIGTGTVDGTATLTVAADGTTGHALNLKGNLIISETVAAAAAGGIPITDPVVLLSVDGTKAYTLVDGQQAGQILTIVVVATTGSPAGTLTPTNLNGYSTIAFNAVGDSVTLMFHNSKWNIIAQNSVTLG